MQTNSDMGSSSNYEKVQHGDGAATDSPTELARYIAHKKGWVTKDGAVYDGDGVFIARTWEAAAAGMAKMQWITSGHGIFWQMVDGQPPGSNQPKRTPVQIADALRNVLDWNGNYPGSGGWSYPGGDGWSWTFTP